MSEDLRHRLDRLESLVDRQQERIAELERRVDERGGDGPDGGNDAESADPPATDEGETSAGGWLTRRDALKTGGLLGLVGFGTGFSAARASSGASASGQAATPTGQVGTSSQPLRALYTQTLAGGVTGGNELTSLTGSGLEVDAGALTAPDASEWSANGGMLSPSGSATGIAVGDVRTDALADAGSGTVSLESTLNVAGNDLVDGGTTVWDADGGYVPRSSLESASLTVAGNAVSLGGSTGVAHGDLDSVSADQHHAKDHDHTEAGVSPVPNAGLADDAVTSAKLATPFVDLATLVGTPVTAGGDIDLGTNTLTNVSGIDGGVTGNSALTNLAGSGLTINSGSLETTSAGKWQNAGYNDLLEPSGRETGIDVTDIRTDNLLDANGSAHLIVNADGPLEVAQTLNVHGNDVNNVASVDGGGSAISVGDNLDVAGNTLTDSTGNVTLDSPLDATGVQTLVQNGSGTALPGTSTNGQIRVFEETGGTTGGRIQFQANGTTFTVNADAGDTYRDEVAFADATGQDPLGPDETRCPTTGKPFETGDPIVHQVDQRNERDDWDEIHAVPMSLDAALDDSETVADHRTRLDDLEAECDAKDARIADQRDRIVRLESTVERKDDEIDQHTDRIDDLEAENDGLRERLAAVETELGLDGGTTTEREVADD